MKMNKRKKMTKELQKPLNEHYAEDLEAEALLLSLECLLNK